jgi:hypothetical protein
MDSMIDLNNLKMEIKPTYVTFEQAKWLKEKGFDEYCEAWQYLDENCMAMQYDSKTCVKMPEQWQVVEWLRVNHGLWIVVNLGIVHEKGTMFFANIIKFGKHHKSKHRTLFYTSPQEAYSTAFDYIRENNLI